MTMTTGRMGSHAGATGVVGIGTGRMKAATVSRRDDGAVRVAGRRGNRGPLPTRLLALDRAREDLASLTETMFDRMSRAACAVACAATVSLSTVAPALAAVKLSPEERNTVSLFSKATPSVVFITNLTNRRDVFTLDLKEIPQGAGSGFVWDDEGHIVTNFHVIKGASDVQITFQDQKVKHGRVVGFDEDRDIAVLQIDEEYQAPPISVDAPVPTQTPAEPTVISTDSSQDLATALRPLPRGSSQGLVVGQRVYAIGNPFGLDHTLTQGIVSGLGREITSGNTGRPIYDVIQTDAAINPGNSGGPLLDSEGNVIGINTAIYSSTGTSSGVGFAIPIDPIKLFVDQILKYGRITQPVLGITFAPDQLVEELGIEGILVLNAIEGGPAWASGMQATTRDSFGRLVLGDIVVGINDQAVKDSLDLYRVLNKLSVGDMVSLDIIRGNAKQKLEVKLMDSTSLMPRITFNEPQVPNQLEEEED